MNPIAYRTTGLAIKTLENLSKAKVDLHGTENIPDGSTIFVINHFTRLETFLMPYYIHKLLKRPVWSIAAAELFVGTFGKYLESVGAVSTRHPDRDRLMIKTLLTGEAGWIIFPEGRMVKSKKIVEKGRYMISYAGGKHPPHTGAANLALRAEFYRQRLRRLANDAPDEQRRLLNLFGIDEGEEISSKGTNIVPINITYYPLRARMNILNHLAARLVDPVPDRLTEELMTEGAMLVSGVDIDIRFGEPIEVAPHLQKRSIQKDMHTVRSFDFDDQLPSRKSMRHAALKIMKRYMDAIYHLTTVNHDHIFASLLKHGPSDTCDLEHFRKRAFLTITEDIDKLSVHLHESLKVNQSHLLIDDRYQKLFDFLSVAEEKGVIELIGHTITRHRAKLRNIFDYDRARIDNPISVIANEVEPLSALHKRISRLSWMPGFMLRAKVAKYYIKKNLREFDEDYSRFFIEGESKPREIGRPVLLRGNSRRVGVVISHGYMSAPAEVRLLANFLRSKGYWVYLPRLRGHGTAPEDLARCSYQEWIYSLEDGYILMRSVCRHVVVGGFSTGAALALELSSRLKNIIGVFAISTPLRLQYLTSKLAPVVDTWNKLMGRVQIKEARMDFVENQPENPHINYLRNPISGVRELERLMSYLEPRLKEITIPALVVQSDADPVVNPSGSERIFNLLGSEDKQYALFNLDRHGIVLGEGSERVHRTIGQWMDQLKVPAAVEPNPPSGNPEP